jgi:hypothetical protein
MGAVLIHQRQICLDLISGFGCLSTVACTVGSAMSTIVNVGSVVCAPGTTSPALQSLSLWRERDDIVFCCVRTERKCS